VTEVPDGGDLPRELSTVDNPSGGLQLTYDGWPLYTFAGDSGPGQANGEGVGGVWFAMTPDGAKATDGSAQGKY
jgi:predicted lipoprotein with Yx(FWY)xxD motif